MDHTEKAEIKNDDIQVKFDQTEEEKQPNP